MKRTQRMKITALLLTLVLLLCNFPIPIFSVESGAESAKDSTIPAQTVADSVMENPDAEQDTEGEIFEIVSRREKNVKHFRMPDGTVQAVVYGTAVHRKDTDGVWQDINNNLSANVSKVKNAYATDDLRLIFAKQYLPNEQLFVLNEDGYSVAMKLMGAPLSTGTGLELQGAASVTTVTNAPTREASSTYRTIEEAQTVRNASSITYTNVRANTDLEYVLTGDSIKENIIVKQAGTSYTYDFALTLSGLTATLRADGSVQLSDADTGTEQYVIPAPYMYDANGNYSWDVSYTLTQTGGGAYRLKVIADPDWINAEGRAFPVTVDPTIKKDVVFDTYVESYNPDTNYGFEEEIVLGSHTVVYIRSNMPSLPENTTFCSANLFLYYHYYDYVTSGSLTAGIYRAVAPWDQRQLTWNTANQNANMGLDTICLGTANFDATDILDFVTFDVTELVGDWLAGEENYGFGIKYLSGMNSSVILTSFDAMAADYPYFHISYRENSLIPNGVYKIINTKTGKYLDVQYGVHTAGTTVHQWSGTDTDGNRSQLFKITYMTTSPTFYQQNYYSVRSLLNCSVGLATHPEDANDENAWNKRVIVDSVPTTDEMWRFSSLNEWSFVYDPSEDAYTIQNSSEIYPQYLTAAITGLDGSDVYTKSSAGTCSYWRLVPYTGAEINGIVTDSYPTTMITGQTFDFNAYMYSSVVGRNGPIVYGVANEDYSDSNKATIDASTGVVTMHSAGLVRISVTFDGAPYIWYYNITVEQSMEGNFHFKNKETGLYMQPDNGDEHFMEQHSDDGTSKQNWLVEHYGNGYYTIRNVDSRLYLTAPDNTTSGSNIIEQGFSTSTLDRQIWRLTEVSSGSYKIQAKAREGTSLVVVVGTGIGSGTNIRQKNYESDTSYRDEWNLISANDKAIVIVPGITCSHLQTYDGAHIWFNDTKFTLNGLDEIACDENGCSIRTDIIPYNPDNYGILNYYKNIYNGLKGTYQEEYDIIFFAYDWRMSCASAAAQLEIVLTNYEDNILVAHSMGGLVASAYLDRSATNRAKVDKLITVGTPYTGAPKALYVIETGELMEGAEFWFNMSEYALNMPAVYELLPSQQYFNRYTSYINNGTAINGFDSSWNFMKTLDWAKKADGSTKPMFDAAVNFHASLINSGVHITEHSDVDCYKIAGYGEETISGVNYDNNGSVDTLTIQLGDQTVPLYSALNNAEQGSAKTYMIQDTHTGLIKNNDCIQLIKSIINGTANSSYALSSEEVAEIQARQSEKVTVVTKKVQSVTIVNGSGYELYVEGSKVYYTDDVGVKHCVGSAWDLGNDSYQYLLESDQYSLENIISLDEMSTIRIDYSATGLSDRAVCLNSLNSIDTISLSEHSASEPVFSAEYVNVNYCKE
ncbi:MAG: RICIN domain-containing protein [Clostridia bacterium]|nr:RICIN domain-containing protein [Clostridia bacterium]